MLAVVGVNSFLFFLKEVNVEMFLGCRGFFLLQYPKWPLGQIISIIQLSSYIHGAASNRFYNCKIGVKVGMFLFIIYIMTLEPRATL